MAKGSHIHKIMTWCIFPIVVEWVKFTHTQLEYKNPMKGEKSKAKESQNSLKPKIQPNSNVFSLTEKF